jgi:hypothetical protein
VKKRLDASVLWLECIFSEPFKSHRNESNGVLTRSMERREWTQENGSKWTLSSPWVSRSTTYAVKAGEKFEVLRVNSLDELTLASPAISGDRLLLRTETRLYSIRKR